jgi:hypothetical protein
MLLLVVVQVLSSWQTSINPLRFPSRSSTLQAVRMLVDFHCASTLLVDTLHILTHLSYWGETAQSWNPCTVSEREKERAVSIDDDLSIDVTFVLVRSRVGTMLKVPRCTSNCIREELIGNERLKDDDEFKSAKLLGLWVAWPTSRSAVCFSPLHMLFDDVCCTRCGQLL